MEGNLLSTGLQLLPDGPLPPDCRRSPPLGSAALRRALNSGLFLKNIMETWKRGGFIMFL